MQNPNSHSVVKRRHLSMGLALGLSVLCAPVAQARGGQFLEPSDKEWHLVHPELGLGGGGLNVGQALGGVWQLDFIIGAEHEQQIGALGGLLKMDLSFFDDPDPVSGAGVYRYDLSLLGTVSSSAKESKPFVRAGVGPMLTWSWVNEREAASGVGVQLEAAAGWKSIAEIYIDTRLSQDQYGPSFGLSAGARLHAILLLALLGG